MADLTKSSVDILNAIRNSASANYRDYVPVASSAGDNIKDIGNIIMDYPSLQNEFLNALVQRIGKVLITNKTYSNPWSMFKRGMLEYGQTIEEIFVDLAKPFEYDPAVAETQIFAREIPDVRAAFHILNYQKYYKTTVNEDQLRQAFVSPDGLHSLVTKIIDALYTSANYDEFMVMKYMIARHIVQGEMYPVTIDENNTVEATEAVKEMSNNLSFMSTDYNLAGVHNVSEKGEQYLIVSSKYDAVMNIEILATAFNMDKADFMGHKVLVDSFGKLDNDRLAQLFEGDSWYEELDSDVLSALDAIPCVLVDKDWFMIVDNMTKFTNQFNGEGLYWNYWYHVWKTFSVSPFHNSIMVVPGDQSVDSITVTPSTVTASAGQSVQFTVVVETTNFASQKVIWSVSDTENASVDIYGNVTLGDDASGEITVTATSAFDDTVVGTATITVS